jgi:hypothetical protein
VPVNPYVGWTYGSPKCGGIGTVYSSAHVCDTHCGRTRGVDPVYTVEVLREMYVVRPGLSLPRRRATGVVDAMAFMSTSHRRGAIEAV